jgi:hypothetical protein
LFGFLASLALEERRDCLGEALLHVDDRAVLVEGNALMSRLRTSGVAMVFKAAEAG